MTKPAPQDPARALGMNILRFDRAHIYYTNWRGHSGMLHIAPMAVYFGRTAHHEQTQWLLRARNLDRRVMRDYALVDVHAWAPQIGGVRWRLREIGL